MPTNKPPLKLSDTQFGDELLATDQLAGLRPSEADPAKRNKRWSAQTVADFVKKQVPGGTEQLPPPYPFVNQSTVTITHNLGRLPAVEIYGTTGGTIRGQLTALNANTLQIIFSQPLSGTVVLR